MTADERPPAATPPPPPDLQLSLGGAELAGLRWVGATLCLRLAAAPTQHIAEHGAREPGYCSGIDVELRNAAMAHAAGSAIGRVRDARLVVAGQLMRRVPLPSTHSGPIALQLDGGDHFTFSITADGLTVTTDGVPRWRPSRDC